jgi:hypothetical protein
MLQHLSGDVQLCLEHAADCDRIAADMSHPRSKQEYLTLARRWRKLAQSFQLVDAIDLYLMDAQKK